MKNEEKMMLEQFGEEYVEFANCLWYYGTRCFSGETIQIPAKKDPKLRPGKGLEGDSGIGIHTERLGKGTPKYVPFWPMVRQIPTQKPRALPFFFLPAYSRCLFWTP